MSEHVLVLPWETPPLSLNQRQHWASKARVTREVRETVVWLARASHLPKAVEHCTVQLHYRPRDNRRRDTDNLTATAKPAFDGLVDYGLVPDDTPRWMDKPEPLIHRAIRGQRGRLWLVIALD